jgi:dihydroorotase
MQFPHKPDDFHFHARSGDMMELTLTNATHMRNLMLMPNTYPKPIETVKQAQGYLAQAKEIVRQIEGSDARGGLHPWATLALTTKTTTTDVEEVAANTQSILGFKYYPPKVTHFGTDDDAKHQADLCECAILAPVLSKMSQLGVVLMLHAESSAPGVDVFDRERHFVDTTLTELVRKYPDLRICVEHVSTAHTVKWLREQKREPNTLGATVTPQHLLFNRNRIFEGGKFHPAYFCAPILNTESDRLALVAAVLEPGQTCFFLGTDSAPHDNQSKHSASVSPGCYPGFQAIELYAEALLTDPVSKAPIQWEAEGMKERWEAFVRFACVNGAAFYGLTQSDTTPPDTTVLLEQCPSNVPTEHSHHGLHIEPLCAGLTLQFRAISVPCSQQIE